MGAFHNVIWSQHSNVQVSIFVMCLNFAGTVLQGAIVTAFVLKWYLVFTSLNSKVDLANYWSLSLTWRTRGLTDVGCSSLFELKPSLATVNQCTVILMIARLGHPSTVPILLFFFLTWRSFHVETVDSFSTLSQCSCHWFSDNTSGVKLDLVCHVIYPTHC